MAAMPATGKSSGEKYGMVNAGKITSATIADIHLIWPDVPKLPAAAKLDKSEVSRFLGLLVGGGVWLFFFRVSLRSFAVWLL
jgi:hypothetical protein